MAALVVATGEKEDGAVAWSALSLFCFSLALIAPPQVAQTCSFEGHTIIAKIAATHLTPDLAKTVPAPGNRCKPRLHGASHRCQRRDSVGEGRRCRAPYRRQGNVNCSVSVGKGY